MKRIEAPVDPVFDANGVPSGTPEEAPEAEDPSGVSADLLGQILARLQAQAERSSTLAVSNPTTLASDHEGAGQEATLRTKCRWEERKAYDLPPGMQWAKKGNFAVLRRT